MKKGGRGNKHTQRERTATLFITPRVAGTLLLNRGIMGRGRRWDTRKGANKGDKEVAGNRKNERIGKENTVVNIEQGYFTSDLKW